MPGPRSDAESLAIVEMLRPFFAALGITSQAAANHLVRKSAHFLEYCLLGILLAQQSCRFAHLREAARRLAVLWCCGAAVAVCDEFIQLFVPRRSGQLADVLLDSAGVLCGLLIAHLIKWRVQRQKV